MRDMELPNPNPRIVAIMDFALREVRSRLRRDDKFADWLAWASSWERGQHIPAACVEIANKCFELRDVYNPIFHTLGQLAWGAKEACYSTPKSAWLTVRYIADAMIAFGVAFPEDGLAALEPTTIDGLKVVDSPDGPYIAP